jgi:hypothetical protein
MNKVYMLLSVLGLSGLILSTSGCKSQTTINIAAATIEQGAYVGATYAIQQNTNNVKYFVLTDAALKKFALGTELDPTAFEKALNDVAPQLQNQWIQLAVDSVVVIYDSAYGEYVIGQVTNNAVAKQFVTAADDGIVRALKPYVTLPAGTRLSVVRVVKCPRPSVVAPKFK